MFGRKTETSSLWKMNTILYVLLPLLVSICQGNTKTEWEASEFPNPQKEPAKCGRYGGKKSFLCDPNGILTVRTADAIDHFLVGAYNQHSVCPCSAYKCETYKQGYSISVALVKKLKVPAGENVLNTGRKFTYDLANSHWNFGECSNNVVILYSADDNLVFTIAGTAASQKLTDEYVKAISSEHDSYFVNNEVGPGLYAMSVDYRNVLEGGYHTPQQRYDTQIPRQTASHTVYTFSTLLTVVAAYCLSYRF